MLKLLSALVLIEHVLTAGTWTHQKALVPLGASSLLS